MSLQCTDREAITVSSTAIGLTTSKIASNVMMATLQVLAADLRATFDGTTPTTDLGYVWRQYSVVEVWGHSDLHDLQMIRDGTSDATVEVQYFGTPS